MSVLRATCGYEGCSKESEAGDYAVQLGEKMLESAERWARTGWLPGPSDA
jgi:hypothetical protein